MHTIQTKNTTNHLCAEHHIIIKIMKLYEEWKIHAEYKKRRKQPHKADGEKKIHVAELVKQQSKHKRKLKKKLISSKEKGIYAWQIFV